MACLVRLANALAFCGAVLVLRGEAAPRRAGAQRLGRDTDTAEMLVITDLLVSSTIVSRYALTTMRSAVHNPGSESQEAVFDVDLPGTAFISNFTLTVNDKVYTAEVKEKETAQRVYDTARRRGQTAAHVATRGRETERFRVAVNVEARGRVDFALTYEELLQRRLGRYELVVSLGPGQVVRNLTVEVAISERAGIEYVQVLPIRTSKLLNNKLKGSQDGPDSTTVERTPTCAWVRFAPTPEQQAQYSSQGIQGDFVVQYDVRPTDLIGDVQTYNGYFVHYFAPRSLPVVTKNVIFVIDVSSSMIGTKIRQTKEAMNTILSDLRPDDAFNIITFSDAVQVWKPDESIQATKQNVQSARKYVSNMVAEGWTDINAALLAAAKFFRREAPSKPGDGAGGEASKVPLVIFLTDGEPTSGVTSTGAIVNNVREAMRGSLSLFCLGFGDDVDFPLLQRLALDNRGVARRIYEDADANLQLKGFYDEVASPLLFDIQLDYLDNRVESVTRTLFPTFFNGSELVVAGRLRAGQGGPLRVRLQATGSSEAVELENEILLNRTEPAPGCPHVAGGAQDFVQRLWAYHTIKELLQARLKMDEEDGRKLLTEKATALSLKYNFVTPLTSMVIVKPSEDRVTTPAAATTARPTASSAGSRARSPSTPGAASSDVLSPSTKSPLAPSERPQARRPHVQGTLSTAAAGTPVPGVPGRSTVGPRGGKGSAAPPVQTAPGTTLETATTVPETPVLFAGGIAATDVPEEVAYATMLRSGDVYVQTKLDSDHFEDEMDSEYYYGIDDDDMEDEMDADYYYGFKDDDMDVTGPGLLRADAEMPYFYSVDGDPHFVVKLPHSNDTVCFTVDGRADDTLRLVEDPLSGVTVDGHLMGAPVNPRHKHRPRNYFDLISVRVTRPAAVVAGWGLGVYRVNVSRQGVTLEGEYQLTVPWDSPSVITKPGLRLTVSQSAGVTLRIGAKIQFLVLLHRYAHPSPLQLDHLGFYIVHGDGLSHHAQGLLGQFQHADMDVWRPKFAGGVRDPGLAELRWRGQKVAVSLRTKMLKDSPLPEHAAPCWLLRREDLAPLIGAYADYVVPRPRSSRAGGL